MKQQLNSGPALGPRYESEDFDPFRVKFMVLYCFFIQRLSGRDFRGAEATHTAIFAKLPSCQRF